MEELSIKNVGLPYPEISDGAKDPDFHQNFENPGLCAAYCRIYH